MLGVPVALDSVRPVWQPGAPDCAQPVACTACHGAEVFRPPTSIGLGPCANGSHAEWSVLRVDDGQGDGGGGVLLMSGGLCLEGPADQRAAFETRAPQQRVRARRAADAVAEAAAAPVVSKVRVTVASRAHESLPSEIA